MVAGGAAPTAYPKGRAASGDLRGRSGRRPRSAYATAVKVKQSPGDFRVEEVSRLRAGNEGDFSLYALAKEGIGTLEALRVISRAWRIARDRIAFAGLKDRYGITVQTVSLRGGPPRNFEGRGFRLNYLGRSPRAAGRGTIAANRFRLRLRALSAEEAAKIAARAREAARDGFPDYYDDQRFGSVRGTGGEFVASALLHGDAERALRLAIASPSREDRSAVKRVRTALRDGWGAWADLAGRLPPGEERRICEALAGGASPAEAYTMVDAALRSLHLSAYQAHLFNSGLRARIGEGPAHPGLAGPYVFYEGDPGPLRDEVVPLASHQAPPHPLLDAALEEEGVTRELLRRLDFRPGQRRAVVVPEDLVVGSPEQDELNPGRLRLALSFLLRPGSYATMLIKRCTWDFPGRETGGGR